MFISNRMSSAGVSRLYWLALLISHSVTFSNPSSSPKTDDFLGPVECLQRNFTRESCDLVFCPPWQYCVDGHCACKPAHQCPTKGAAQVCGHGNKQLKSYCQAMAVSCLIKIPIMSHFGDVCTDAQPKFSGSIDANTGLVRLLFPGRTGCGVEELLVCQELWDMAAANVVCRKHGHILGASFAGTVPYLSLEGIAKPMPSKCVSVRCQGYENSLAECVIYDKTSIGDSGVATVTCQQLPEEDCKFKCVNRKCVSLSQTCDGVDDCGDGSDEMCCKKCRNGAFRCSTGVCFQAEAIQDGQMDCLDGEDESKKHTKPSLPVLANTEYISPRSETMKTRTKLESRLSCGISSTSEMGSEDDDDEWMRERGGRIKRVVGLPTKPTQIQWQVSMEMKGTFHCGGAYIGGSWVLTAAHCMGTYVPLSMTEDAVPGQNMQKPNLAAMKVKFSLWHRMRIQASTDTVPVVDVHIHPRYDSATRENDIALVQLIQPPDQDNLYIRPVCVPWTPRLFNPNHSCIISGWGQGGRLSQILRWANVFLIEDCQQFYKESLKPGMICAGTLDGSAHASQGDNGGPLVCEDELGVSYLWGIVSWGPNSTQPPAPAVYTQVAHYFEWIRRLTGWSAVTKFNSL